MRISGVCVACCRRDVHLTRICVGSLRFWYPELPLFLVRDYTDGAFSTAEIECAWNVGVFQTRRRINGWGMSKLEVVVAPRTERYLVLDSDIALAGKVVELLESYSEDFLLAGETFSDPHAPEVQRHYYNWEKLRALDPEFQFPGFCFNTGQFVVNCGRLKEADFAAVVGWSEPPVIKHPEVFFPGDQGVLNYVLHKKRQAGQLSLRDAQFCRWSGDAYWKTVSIQSIRERRGDPMVIHWAGTKSPVISQMAQPEMLRFFEDFYYTRVPSAALKRLARRGMSYLVLARRSMRRKLRRRSWAKA